MSFHDKNRVTFGIFSKPYYFSKSDKKKLGPESV